MLTYWILGLMMALQPDAPWGDSYLTTAAAIATVVDEQPPLFAGPDAVEQTAALLVSVAFFEGTFRPDAVGDHGRSHSMWQIQAANLSEGVTLTAIDADTELAAREALRIMRQSFRVCRRERPEFALAHYAAGGNGCRAPGFAKSRHRIDLARRLMRDYPPPSPPS